MKNKKNISYHHGNLRNALIEAGVEILAHEGNNALSLRKVARKVGVSHAAPYRHFANKEILIVAIAEEGYLKLEKKMRWAIAKFPNASDERLIELGWAYIQFALENPNHLRVMFNSFSESCDLETGDTFSLLVNAVKEGQEANYVVAGDATEIALSLWATVHGLSMLLIENKIPIPTSGVIDVEKVAKSCLRVSYAGVRKK